MKTVEKRVFVSEMSFNEHVFLVGLLKTLQEGSPVTIEREDDKKYVNDILNGLKTK